VKLFICFTFLFCFAASALETPTLPLRGQGEYKWLFMSVYEARLLAEKGNDIYSRPLLLELKYSRSFKGKDIVDQSIKELVSAGNDKSQLKEWREKLLGIFPDVKESDVIRASYNPEIGIVFHFNSEKELGRITDLTFSKKFLDIWLGEKTSAPDLRKKLLGSNI
jgi:hypothetical protein